MTKNENKTTFCLCFFEQLKADEIFLNKYKQYFRRLKKDKKGGVEKDKGKLGLSLGG